MMRLAETDRGNVFNLSRARKKVLEGQELWEDFALLFPFKPSIFPRLSFTAFVMKADQERISLLLLHR